MDYLLENHGLSQLTQYETDHLNRPIATKELNLKFFKLKKYTSMSSMPRYFH